MTRIECIVIARVQNTDRLRAAGRVPIEQVKRDLMGQAVRKVHIDVEPGEF